MKEDTLLSAYPKTSECSPFILIRTNDVSQCTMPEEKSFWYSTVILGKFDIKEKTLLSAYPKTSECSPFILIRTNDISQCTMQEEKSFWVFYCDIGLVLYGPQRKKTCLQGFENNTGASAQSDQRLCYSLFRKVSYVNLLQANFNFQASLCS